MLSGRLLKVLPPLLDEVDLAPLTGDMLYDAVQRKKPTAGSLDGWGWREFKALPVAWFDGLAAIFTLVEEEGVWPDGLLDAYVAMIPKSGGFCTPLGQRPLCVLPIAYRLWASVRLNQLEPWFESWVPRSVFSAGGGRGSVEAWYATALDLEESLSGALDSDVHILWPMLLNHLTRWIGVFLTMFLVVWSCLLGFGMRILSIMPGFGYGSNSLVAMVRAGLGMGAFRRGGP